MTQRQLAPFRAIAKQRAQSLRKEYLRGIVVAAILASSIPLAGCQQIGFRSRGDDLKQLIAEQDDWDLPMTPQNRVPRPQLGEAPLKRQAESAEDAGHEGRVALARRSPKQVSKQEASEHSDNEELESESDSIIDTPYQDIEIDNERAVAALPPNSKFREVLKKQLEIGNSRSITALPKSPLPKNASQENRTKGTHDQTFRDVRQTTEPNNEDEPQILTQATPREKQAGKVTVRMSDSPADYSNSSLARATPPPAMDASAVNTFTESQPVTVIADSMHSQVQRANAVAPIRSRASSESSGLPEHVQPAFSPLPAPHPSQLPAAAPPLSWRQLLSQSIEQLEKQIKEIPAGDDSLRISQEVTLRMLYLCQRRLNDATSEIDVLSEQEQDYFRHQMQALYEASNPDAMPVRSRHWSLVMNSQREATNLLAAISNLEVKSVAFCTEVEGFGVVTKFPKYQFSADQELLLYCEVENVSATKVKEGYESQLQGSYEILDAQGRKVADQLLPVEAEICQNHRRDYFIVYKIFMPQQISAGNYQLRLTVEDTKARKFGQSHLDFQIKK